MKYGYNSVTLIGEIAEDIRLGLSKAQKPYARIQLKIPNPTQNNEATTVQVICFNEVAKNLSIYRKKGDLILVEGKLATQEQQIGGHEVKKYSIIGNSIIYLPNPNEKQQIKKEKPIQTAYEYYTYNRDSYFFEPMDNPALDEIKNNKLEGEKGDKTKRKEKGEASEYVDLILNDKEAENRRKLVESIEQKAGEKGNE